jgi:ankyrin repeat protein
MKFYQLFILCVAAGAGSLIYNVRKSGQNGEQSIYQSLTGPGSFGQTLKSSKAERDTAFNSGTKLDLSGGAMDEALADDMPLIEAAAKGDKAALEKRLDQHVKIDSRDRLRRTALMYAAWNGNDDICNRLLAAGANPEFKDRDGNNVFDYAAGRGHSGTVNFLLEHTRNADTQHYREYATLIQAAYRGDPALIPAAAKPSSINRINPEGQAPLHIAAGNGSVAVMDALLQRGAQVNIANSNRQTPLQWAAWNNQPQAVALLLKKGADINYPDAAGNTALILAAQNNSKDCIKPLLAAGADKYAANKQGKNAAILAEDGGYRDIAALLQ